MHAWKRDWIKEKKVMKRGREKTRDVEEPYVGKGKRRQKSWMHRPFHTKACQIFFLKMVGRLAGEESMAGVCMDFCRHTGMSSPATTVPLWWLIDGFWPNTIYQLKLDIRIEI